MRRIAVSFCRENRTGVWFEGTAHLADALRFRRDPGDNARAARYLADIYGAGNKAVRLLIMTGINVMFLMMRCIIVSVGQRDSRDHARAGR